MKAPKIVLGSLLLTTLIASGAYAQQQFIQTVSKQNKDCNSVCSVLDVPELNNNPAAIIFITPIDNSRDLNPHPIGAYYMYLKKWSIFNLDGKSIAEGSKFKIEYYARPDKSAFAFTVPMEARAGDLPYIDREGLNGDPNAQVRVFPTSSPKRGALYNRDDVKAVYDATAHKWYIANINGKPVPAESVYNVAVSSGGLANTTAQTPVDPRKDTGTLASPFALPPTGAPALQVNPPLAGMPFKQPVVARWELYPDAEPTIPPNSDILLFIHGMDSRAEEADDITKALFALKDAPRTPAGSSSPPMVDPMWVPVLQQLLEKFKWCILERYETKIDMISRGLSPDLSGLATTNGLQPRDTVTCMDGSTCSLASRSSAYVVLLAQANRGDATDFEAKLESAIPADCFQCAKHQEWHTKHVHCTMEIGGNGGAFGPPFQICQAGVYAATFFNELIDAVHGALNGPGVGNKTGGPTIASNYSTVQFNSCPIPSQGCTETCDHHDAFSFGSATAVTPVDMAGGQPVTLYFEPMVPPSLLDTTPPPGQTLNTPAGHNIGKNEGRLRQDLRTIAAIADPLQSLQAAANAYAAGDPLAGQAFADLSVTGSRSFAAFRSKLPNGSFCQTLPVQTQIVTPAAVFAGCLTALDRAYRVANFLRTGERGDTPDLKAKKIAERNALGWIAVSGEDDQPHRPVNVPSSDYPQYDITVTVPTPLSPFPQKTVDVQARYVIAQSQTTNPAGRNLVIISVDLPSSGYTTNINFNRVSTLLEIGSPKETKLAFPLPVPPGMEMFVSSAFVGMGLPPPPPVIPVAASIPDFQSTGKTPVLDFDEDFIVDFAQTLAGKNYVELTNFKAVMGGSLGGNMTFRLGRRPNVDWMPKFIVWSPASIWQSLGEGSDILKHIGPNKAWMAANQAMYSPTDGDRADFFGGWDKPVVPFIIPMAQSDTWTSDYYACKKSSIAGARMDRQETYDHWFLAWHWRLGGEQLLYSHQTIDPATKLPRYMSNRKPMLLGCGLEDHVAFNDICPATQKTAKLMIVTPGKALFLDKTGHSLDNERRMFWAQQILVFLH